MIRLATAALIGLMAIQSAQADPTLDKIKAAGKVTVATEAAFEPFEYTVDGKIVGYGSDILVAVVQDLGVRLDQLDIPFQGILAGLEAGQYDFVATTVGITPERAKHYAFTRPIGAIESVVMVPAADATIKAPADLVGKVVATQLGSTTEGVARAFAAKQGAFKDLRLVQSFPDAVFQLGAGQVDAVVVGSPTAFSFLKSQPGKFKVVGSIGEPAFVGWVTRPADKDLRTAIDATLTRLIDTGQMAKLQTKWFGFTMATPATGYLPDGAIH